MIFAAIDMGSNAVKLKIAQFSDERIEILDQQSIKISIGDQVYRGGYISQDSISEIIRIIQHFKRSIESFGADHFRAVATGAARDAANSLEAVEIISMKTGVQIEILEDSIEKFLTYKSMRDNVPEYMAVRQGALIVEVNSGSTDVTMYKNNKLISNDEIRMGSKYTKPFLLDIESKTNNYAKLLREYVGTQCRRILRTFGNRKFEYFVANGAEAKFIMDLIIELRGEQGLPNFITREEFKLLIQKTQDDSYEIRSKYPDRWHEFLISITIFDTFLEGTKAEKILVPNMSLRDGIIAEMIAENGHRRNRYELFDADIYSMALEISKKFKCISKHVRNVEKNCLKIYDYLQTKIIFGPDSRKHLRLAALLAETGRYVRLKDFELASFSVISNLEIFGISKRDLKIVAYIARNLKTGNERLENMKETIMVRKLSQILALALALDSTRRQKVNIINTKLVKDNLNIQIEEVGDASIEKIQFSLITQKFYETFGIMPIIE